MPDNVKLLLNTLLALRSKLPSDHEFLSDSKRQIISLELWSVLVKTSRMVMGSSEGGLNIFDPMDLASSVLEKLVYSENPGILKFEGESEGELVNFLKTTLKFALIDDHRKLVGRAKKKERNEAELLCKLSPDDMVGRHVEHLSGNLNHASASDFNPNISTVVSSSDSYRDTFIPRVFLSDADPEGNQIASSERRTATGYLLLKQTREHLDEYLRKMPGSIVLVPYGQRSQKQGVKRVTLTQGHAEMLRLWMSGEGDDHWKDIAHQLNRPLGTIKRWWSEAVLAFQSDGSSSAKALRDLYRFHPEHLRRAHEGMDQS